MPAEIFFPNFEETGYEEISDWTPTYYQDILETDVLMKFAGGTVDTMALQLERWCKNMFIDTMDEEMLSRMEAFYYMGDNSDRPIDERRRLLKSMQMGSGKMSRDRISRIVQAYTGLIPEIEFYHALKIKAHFDDNYTLTPSDLPKILAQQLPAHIKFLIEFMIYVVFQGVNEETVDIPHIGFDIPIYNFDFLALDGTWDLDGTYLLNAGDSYDPLVGLITPYGIEEELEPAELSDVNNIISLVTDEEVNGNVPSIVMNVENSISLKQKFGATYPIDTDEEVGTCTLEQWSADAWFLDGEFFLDGSKYLNVIHTKEDI